MNNKFNKNEARVVVYGPEYDYKVYVANNLAQLDEIVGTWTKPAVYMKNFKSWEELEAARKCYEWQMSAFPHAKYDVEKPTEEEEEWFWQKQLDDEYMVKDIKQIVAAYDDLLPDSPDVYLSSKENLTKNEILYNI